jgi:hypothetical protein
MNKVLILGILCSFLLLAACVQKEVTSQQSIQDIIGKQSSSVQDIIGKQPSINGNNSVTPVKNGTVPAINQTKPVANLTPVVSNEKPNLYKKCKYSAIVYGGCKWTDNTKSVFRLTIQSAAKKSIPAIWLFITGESGAVKAEKRTEQILSGATRTYTINYDDLVKEIGVVKRVEVWPVEVMNGTEYTCENQRVYTIPNAYCKSNEAINADNITGMAVI